MAMESVDLTSGAVPFGFIQKDDNDLFQVANGLPASTAIATASTLEAATREMLSKTLENGLSAHQAELCRFGLEAAQALRAAAGQQQEPEAEAAPSGRFDPDEDFHSFDKMRALCGLGRYANVWHETSLKWSEAESLARVDSALSAVASIAELLAVDGYARVVGPDCAGTFQQLDDDLMLGMHTGLQRLVQDAIYSLERTREALEPKAT